MARVHTTIRVAKLAMDDMMPVTIPQASFDPWAVFGCLTIGPIPFARTTAQMKKATPAIGTTMALAVNKCRILWTGNQMAGNEKNQKRKKERNMSLDVPDPGMVFFMFLKLGQMAEIMR